MFGRKKEYYKGVIIEKDKLEVGKVYQIGNEWFVYLGYTELKDLALDYIKNSFNIEFYPSEPYMGNTDYYCFIKLGIDVTSKSYKNVDKIINTLKPLDNIILISRGLYLSSTYAFYSIKDMSRNDIAFSDEIKRIRVKSMLAGIKVFSENNEWGI